MQEKLIRRSTRALFAAAWLSVAPSAFAVSLGDVEVRSALGESFDARVPLGLERGEVVDATCFALTSDPKAGIPVLTDGLLSVERVGEQSVLHIRSPKGVFEPAVRVRLRAGCPGQSGEVLREYSVLLDARRDDAAAVNGPVATTRGVPAAAANRAAGTPATTPYAARLDARPGDTLHGLATKVFPGNRAARDIYLQAMRDANPALASLGDQDAIPAGANVALPDLRTFARSAASRRILATAQAQAPRTREVQERPSRQEPPPRAAAAKPEVSAGAQPTALSPRPSAGGFLLKLSGGDLDISRSREVDDRTRAQLRERLMVLDSDDEVAAMLALRNRLSQLEAQVNELQLKLAQMPSSFPARPAAEAPAPAPMPSAATTAPMTPAAPAPVEAAPKAEATPSPPETRQASAAVAETPKAEAAKSGSASDAPAEASASQPPAQNAAPAKPAAKVAKPAPSFDVSRLWQSYSLWAAFIAVLALLMLLAWRLTHRGEPEYETAEWEQAPPPGDVAMEPSFDDEAPHDATLALEAPDAGALRRRYIEERFPEVANGALALDDPASVVKGARLLYEDGALPRAIELLQFAIEENPMEVRPWLALFEIFRLERLTGEFAELARRFYEQHGNTEYWRKIRYFGREIDPGNFLYREDVDALETIPPGARAKAEDRFDAARENWLGAPMDFDNEVLANELRQALMANAGVVDQDLVPNPMPALRDAEMFTVA